MGRATGSLSVASALLAGIDWAVNLLVSPGKRAELQLLALEQAHQLANYAVECALAGPSLSNRCVTLPARDRRFAGEAWHAMALQPELPVVPADQQWWHNATTGVRGVDRQHESMVAFATRQLLDMVSPANRVDQSGGAEATLDEGGMNLVRGAQELARGLERAGGRKPPAGAERSTSAATSPSRPARWSTATG